MHLPNAAIVAGIATPSNDRGRPVNSVSENGHQPNGVSENGHHVNGVSENGHAKLAPSSPPQRDAPTR